MTSKDIKIDFEKKLSQILLTIAKNENKINATKKSITISSEHNITSNGVIKFDYLSGQKAYYFSMMGYSLDFSKYITEINPPYPSNIPSGLSNHLGMSTLMENRGHYSRSDGKIYIPKNFDPLNEIFKHIEECLVNIYIPWVRDFIENSPKIIESIIKNPEFYSYPIPLMVYIAKKNSIKFLDLNLQIGKNLIKNKKFDNYLIETS